MRRSTPSLIGLCILSALLYAAAASAQEPAPKLTGTPVKAPDHPLPFGGHIERLNAQLPSPWPGLNLHVHPAAKALPFNGTYWEGVAQACAAFDCNITPGYRTVDFSAFDGSAAHLSPQGPLLFILTQKFGSPHLYIFTEPHMGIVDVPPGKLIINGKATELSYGAGDIKGPFGALNHGWRLDLDPSMTGPLTVEVEVVLATAAATLSLPPKAGATASQGHISATVTDATESKVNVDVKGGPLLSFYTNHSALERATGGGSIRSDGLSWSYNVVQWPADTQIILSVGTTTTTQRVTATFNEVDYKALTSDK